MHSILNGVSQLKQPIKETNIRKIFGSGNHYVPRKILESVNYLISTPNNAHKTLH